MYGESEDEILARRLQEEEERSLNHNTNHSAMSGRSGRSQLSAQEREDMMLARQMQEMDSFGQHGAERPSPRTDPPTQPTRRDSRDPTGAYAAFVSNNNNKSPGGVLASPSAGNKEDRLAYARRLQEQAFQRMQATAQPPKSTEESDLELAMKMQIEEGGGDASHLDQEDEDLKLARFMEESGVSIRDLDENGLAAAKDGSANNLPLLPTSSGLPNHDRRAGGGGGGLLGGLYGNSRDDDDDDEEGSLEFGFGGANQKMPAGVPCSIPPPGRTASGIPPSIPAAAGMPSPVAAMPSSIPPLAAMPITSPTPGVPAVASIPSAIPPASSPTAAIPPGNRKPPPAGSAPVAAINLPGGRQASIRLNNFSRGQDFQRQLPKPSKSSGAGTGSRLGRMLPTASKSFGAPRSGLSRNAPTHTQSAHNLMGLRNAARNSPKQAGRSVSPNRRQGRLKNRAAPPAGMDQIGDMPDMNAAAANGNEAQQNSTPQKKKKGKIFSRMFGGGKKKHEGDHPMPEIPDAIPAAIPGPFPTAGGAAGGGAGVGGDAGPLPHSVAASRNINQNSLRTSFNSGNPQPEQRQKQAAACSVCGGRTGKMLVAMDRKFHVECFRCMSCNQVIDPSSVFAVSVDPMGGQQPLHRKCYAEFYGVQCAVCKKAIPANDDGSVSFIKHPFFNTEQMCPSHAEETGRRRCTGCHRFEPEDEPFADLNDGDRCVCYACCRTVIMNNMDVKPLWGEVLRFFEFQLGLPIWEEMREIPILVVGQAALNENQLKDGTSVHGDSSQIMTRGLCLSEHDGSMSFRVPSQRFNDSTASFEACNHSGFMDFDVGNLKGNSKSEVMAILCLSGLPRDLTASVLAHEATHAWIKLHPDFKVRKSLPAQVEEGCAQLVAYLFLSDGLEPPRRHSGLGPSDEKLRQYFKFSIETDDNDIYGEGYRRAALAYSTIGIAALLNHVVHFQEFPNC